MPEYHRSLLLMLSFLALFNSALVIFADLKRPIYGDEDHFVRTIKLFGEDLSLKTLKHYDEMPTPLTFILYSLWGRIFGFDVHILRIFSILVAISTYLMIHRLLFIVFENSKIAVLTSIFIMLNPYMVGIGF